jgi:hypothetical protein
MYYNDLINSLLEQDLRTFQFEIYVDSTTVHDDPQYTYCTYCDRPDNNNYHHLCRIGQYEEEPPAELIEDIIDRAYDNYIWNLANLICEEE